MGFAQSLKLSPSPSFLTPSTREVHCVGPLLVMAVKHIGWVQPRSPSQLGLSGAGDRLL